jgi:fructokinase
MRLPPRIWSSARSCPVSGITVVGEALVDIMTSPAGVQQHPGGSPLNVAVGLARLGDDVELLTRVGSDALGNAILEHARSSGVSVLAESVTASRTSSSTARLDDAGAPPTSSTSNGSSPTRS